MQRSFELSTRALRRLRGYTSRDLDKRANGAHEPELLNSRCLTAVGLPTYSVHSHCRMDAESDQGRRSYDKQTRLFGLYVPDVDVATGRSYVNQVPSRVEAGERGDFPDRHQQAESRVSL